MPHPPSPAALNTPLSRGWKGGNSISASVSYRGGEGGGGSGSPGISPPPPPKLISLHKLFKLNNTPITV